MNIVHRLRSPLIAFVVLALSATAVFAARTISESANASNVGLAQANVAASHAPDAVEVGARNTPSERTDSTTGTDATTGTKPPDNHGPTAPAAASLSFDALKAACGGNLKNKGAYISAIARGLYVFTSSAGKVTCAPAPTHTASTTGTDATTGTKPPDNHGATVSGAASLSFDALQAACGGNLTNKGAYISAIARGLYVFTSSAGKVTCAPAPTHTASTTG